MGKRKKSFVQSKGNRSIGTRIDTGSGEVGGLGGGGDGGVKLINQVHFGCDSRPHPCIGSGPVSLVLYNVVVTDQVLTRP